MRLEGEYAVLIRPVVTEKTASLAQFNQYVFLVHRDANKTMIKDAVQKAFKVKVVNVRTVNQAGKLKRRGMRWVHRPSRKRAIITLAKGSQLDPTALS